MIEHPCGLETEWREFQILFGNKQSSLAALKETYPLFKFIRLKQVHGSQIHEITSDSPDWSWEGDGAITNARHLALCSITGDCVPILMASPDSGWCGAFHAGWRGVAARLVPKGIERLLEKGASNQDLRIWIGPHILQDSFEVDADVRDQLIRSLPPEKNGGESRVAEWAHGKSNPASASMYFYEDSGKYRVSLLQILLEQISAMRIPLSQVEMELDDTKTNAQFHSARRDKEQSGRQISWIGKR